MREKRDVTTEEYPGLGFLIIIIVRLQCRQCQAHSEAENRSG